jgi:ClpP class serine protease
MHVVCRTYEAFLEHVSAGRNMDIDEVRSLARGRVWSGQDAFQHGLVDGLGGLSDAISTAKELANLPQVSHLQAFSTLLTFFHGKLYVNSQQQAWAIFVDHHVYSLSVHFSITT